MTLFTRAIESVDIVTIVWDSTSAIESTIEQIPQRFAAVNTTRKSHSATDNRYGLVALRFRRCGGAIGQTFIFPGVSLEGVNARAFNARVVDARAVNMVIWGRNTPRSSRFSHLDTTRIIGGSGITQRGISVRQQKISIRASSIGEGLMAKHSFPCSCFLRAVM